MHHEISKISLLAALLINLTLAACGGAGGSSGIKVTAGDFVSINGVTYATNSSTVHESGALDQASQYGYLYGGSAAVISMNDAQSGNSLSFQVLSTVNGWPGVFTVLGTGTNTTAYITDKSVATSGNMQANSMASGTGGSITFSSFGAVWQPITGCFNINLCDFNAVCAASIKNHTGSFGIHPSTGKNYFTVLTNATGGTLTLSITLTSTVDVNMAVYSDAGFTTPATCNITNTQNVAGNGIESCAISVVGNQRIYVTVSQPASAVGQETFTLALIE